jgi:hypothetical protein
MAQTANINVGAFTDCDFISSCDGLRMCARSCMLQNQCCITVRLNSSVEGTAFRLPDYLHIAESAFKLVGRIENKAVSTIATHHRLLMSMF